MLLTELIAQTAPLPYKWLSNTVCSFAYGKTQFVVVFEPFESMQIGNRELNGINIAFGVARKMNTPEFNVSTELTGKHLSPRVIISTVAHAVLERMKPISTYYNFITIGAKGDRAMASRAKIYKAAVVDVADKIEQFGYEYPYDIMIGNSLTMILSQVQLNQVELNQLKQAILQQWDTEL